MPKVQANGITINYEQQGSGEPLLLIPYLAADNACYAFQVADYANRFTCISVDPRGAGESDKPQATYSTELFADDIAAFMQTIGVDRAHVSGLSLGAATGLWLAAKYPKRVKSLSLHSCWPKGQRYRNDHSGHPALVLHAGFLFGQSRIDGQRRSLRAEPAKAAARRIHAPVERGDHP